ncbi:sensor histidine kinase [Labilibacter marinus]|uniref:sensor histidine kinase n=1 Tax=Labilibacter marinus TaxID=1477105 RepID=UPI00082B974F|nr:HAMP domain-containing sensor histidine kinase [Labilibacter marinus]
MSRYNLKRSLYWRLSLSFLLVLLIVSFSYITITIIASDKYYQETTQRLNAEVAEYLLKESPPFKNGEVNKEALGVIMHSMMAVNPGIEVYLVSPDGEILSFVVLDKKVKLSRVDVEPVKEFIATKGEKYILGDDPRNPGEQTIFSATGVTEGEKFLGYIYIVLDSEKHENIAAAVSGSYWLKVGLNSFIITLITAFSLGIALIWMLTKNIRVIIQTVNKFKEGDLHARIPESAHKGELAVLAGTFNSMSDTILENIEELKKVDQLRRELIANVSHDLRNPLAIIHGYIETLMMKSDSLEKEEVDRYLKVVLESSEKLTRLVSDLFELSKLEAGQIQMKKEPFFAQELLSDANTKVSLLAKNKQIEISSDLSEAAPMVFADLSMIDRVIQNLLDNAIKYTPEQGKIFLQTNIKNGGVEVRIKNTGSGIAQNDLPHIFDRYYKIDKTELGIQGTGLGLAIVKKIIDGHDANIHVESVEGEYAEFIFNLPAYSA